MRVRKIINWPLTLFTLLSIVIICILGLSLAQTAFFTAWGREHIAYNSNVEMVKSNLDNELQNKIANVDGFKEVVEAGACVDEKGLVQLFQSVISQGEWDVYGFVGTTRKVFTKDGILLNAGEMETLDEVLDKHPENDVFWGEDSYAEYLFFPEEVVVGGNPIRLFFAVNMNALLQELTIKDGIDGNPVCLINESGEVLSSVDLEDTFDYGTLKATDFYNNPSNKVNSQYLRSIMDSYISKDSKFIIVYLASGEDGKQHSYAATITDDDTEEPIQTEIQSDEVAEASTMTEALESYSVNFGGFMWYEKPLSFSNAGMMKLLLGKPKEISGGMLQSSLYIMTMYAVVVIILFIMFIMQIIFTVHSNRKLYKVAYIDPITKVRNWTRFVLDAKRLIKKRKNRKYAMVMFDIDKFNVYNDLYGHGEGDILLSQVAKYLNKHMRKKRFLRVAVPTTSHF